MSVEKSPERKLVSVLDGKPERIPPIWLMRQAGRYLPEYRALRKEVGGFLAMCYTPEHAIEITLQPIRRFNFDAAILFSDILVVPDAMGQQVRFEEGRGPVLAPMDFDQLLKIDDQAIANHLHPVIEAVAGIREALPAHTTLLGFCGAPWTVATYMIAGHSTSDQAPARLFAHKNREEFQRIIDRLVTVSADYLIAQLRAGADAVQIFDSWAGVLGEADFKRWCQDPVARIVSRVRAAIPDARIIGFPKGAGMLLDGYREETGVHALGLDWTVPLKFAKTLQAGGPIQGCLDPTRLVAGGDALNRGIDDILSELGDGPFIFNLGHGITPDTPIAHVEQLIARVRES